MLRGRRDRTFHVYCARHKETVRQEESERRESGMRAIAADLGRSVEDGG